MPVARTLGELQHLLACPACGGFLEIGDSIECTGCGQRFPIADGAIPQLFFPQDKAAANVRDVTGEAKSFYKEHPFPNYDGIDSRESLQKKVSAGIFARSMNEQLPRGVIILEAGCRTGQLSNFLGMSAGRRVIGADLCLDSLRAATKFQEAYEIANAGFLQMNLFRPAFRPESFDVIISNGVLHHTNDPLGAFLRLVPLLKPGGVFAVGLYNRLGRLATDFRHWLFPVAGEHERPHQSTHGYSEIIEEWFEANGFEFLTSIPKIGAETFRSNEKLFIPHNRGNRFNRLLTEVDMLVRGGVDGALFII